MLRAKKEKTVDDLQKKMSLTKSLFVTDYRGLNVEEMTKLRRELRKAGAEYKITKNTMIRRAAEQSGLEAITGYLKGPTGLILSYQDPAPPAKILHEILQKSDKPKIRTIWMEGRLLGSDYLKRLATLPSREVVLSQILAGLNAPVANFLGTLQATLRNFVGVVEAIREAKTGAA
ncbi:MAG: 50S ribosomal protein L10 [Candidatus Zixiibacteriota bacterium]